MADFDFGDGLRKVFLAGVGALATTVEKSQEIVDDLVHIAVCSSHHVQTAICYAELAKHANGRVRNVRNVRNMRIA